MDTKARVDAVLSEAPYKPLHESVVRISLWDGRPLPLRRWAIENCVPAFQICGFFGEGGSGKSILEMMKDAAHVLGSNWLSLVPVPGPAIFLSSEDHIDELQVRLSRVADHYGVGLTQLEDRGFHLISRYGEDTLLCEATRSGRIMPTKLYTELREMIGDIKPKNVSLELSRIYAGSEIDRVSVNQLAEHLQALALLTDAGSVTLLGHPSLTGIASGTGSSGTTGWHGSFRARCYLRHPSSGRMKSKTAACGNWCSSRTSMARCQRRSSFASAMAYGCPTRARRKKIVSRGRRRFGTCSGHAEAVNRSGRQRQPPPVCQELRPEMVRQGRTRAGDKTHRSGGCNEHPNECG